MEYLLQIDGICKSFGSTKALSNVDFTLKRGEIHGLIGENGSGKSTLSSIIAGIQRFDSGEMKIHGEIYAPENVLDAAKHGICMIVQEQGTFSACTVAQNIFIGDEKQFENNGLLNVKRMNEKAAEILDTISAGYISPSTRCGFLSFEERKLVEVAKAVYSDPDILIVDETTTSFTQSGREIVYRIMDRMRTNGKSVIFISHDIDEVITHCNRVTLLRDGILIETLDRSQFDKNHIRQAMVGRKISDQFFRSDTAPTRGNEVALDFENVSQGILKNISFTLYRGEIIGVGGLADCGIHSIGRLAFGLDRPESGVVRSAGGESIRDPVTAMRNRIGYVSKNRDKESLLINGSIRDNMILPSMDKLSKMKLLFPKRERAFVDIWARNLQIKMGNMDDMVSTLSGGNKQKVAIAKWLGFDADVLILDCPTRGIDVGVKAAIYNLMEDLKRQGKAILMISEEMPELIGLSDRILILKNGHMSAELCRSKDINERTIIKYML